MVGELIFQFTQNLCLKCQKMHITTNDQIWPPISATFPSVEIEILSEQKVSKSIPYKNGAAARGKSFQTNCLTALKPATTFNLFDNNFNSCQCCSRWKNGLSLPYFFRFFILILIFVSAITYYFLVQNFCEN